jgi:hypothetical protein
MQTLLGYHERLIESRIKEMEHALNHLKVGSRKFLFLHFAETFFDLIWDYSRVFVRSYVEASKRVGVDTVPRGSREAYAKFVPKFNLFVQSYAKFAKRVNGRMEVTQSEVRVSTYIEDAPPLI